MARTDGEELEEADALEAELAWFEHQKAVNPLSARVSMIEVRVAGLKMMSDRIRENLVRFVDGIGKLANQSAMRKGLDSGDEYKPVTSRDNLDGAVLQRLTHPSALYRNGNGPKED